MGYTSSGGRAFTRPWHFGTNFIPIVAIDLNVWWLNRTVLLLRKEVIQPQVPLRLPCYDFIPVTSCTLGPCLLVTQVGADTSGATGSHDVTGGVYKTRERIHGTVADAPLLAIPASWRRVAASNPN